MEKILNDFDFSQLDSSEFKEDSVRAFVIDRILEKLGFKSGDSKLEVRLSQALNDTIVVGSNKQIEATLVPDYTLYVESQVHCVLDAKAPSVSVDKDSKAEKQTLSYAVSFKSPYYALCNGWELVIFKTDKQEAIFKLNLKDELESKFSELKTLLTTPIESFKKVIGQNAKKVKKPDSWYLERGLPKAIKKPKKQARKRYFGCMPYFTTQSWDVVTSHIRNFTDEGDIVLDSFGGSGVTAIEALMNGRIGIHTDLNPLSIFMTKALSAKCDLGELQSLSETILSEFETLRPKNEKQAKEFLKGAKYYPNAIDKEFGEIATQKEQDSILWIPQDEILPKGSDVSSALKLFNKKQLAELAILRKLIFKHTTPSGSKENRLKKRNLRYSLLLAFYNTLKNINLTFHKSVGGGGDSAVFRYYRYRIAKKPTFLDTKEVYSNKIQHIIKGKKELDNSLNFYDAYFEPINRVIKDFEGALITQRKEIDLNNLDSLEPRINGDKIFQADATNLKEIESNSIDFIYTDPPYGAKIPYLDLSTMWNVWLDLPFDRDLKEKECIEKGSLEKSKDEYHTLMNKSLKEMFRVLKFNRWMAFCFQHHNIQLWQNIKESAESYGFEYVKSLRQSNGQTSFKKRQNPFSVVSGQLIMYFRKVENPQTKAKHNLGKNINLLLDSVKDEIVKSEEGLDLDELSDLMMITAMDNAFLDDLNDKYEDVLALIDSKFSLDTKTKKYHIKEPHKHSKLPLEVRAKYFIKNYLKKCELENRAALFDDICYEVIPHLSNGITPRDEDVLDILEKIAEPVSDNKKGEWKLNNKGEQGTLIKDY